MPDPTITPQSPWPAFKRSASELIAHVHELADIMHRNTKAVEDAGDVSAVRMFEDGMVDADRNALAVLASMARAMRGLAEVAEEQRRTLMKFQKE